MNSSERLRAVINFHETDRPPVIPQLIGVTATMAGVSPRDYVTSGATIAKLQLEAQREIGHDALLAIADLCVEAEAVGCKVEFPPDNYPYVVEPAFKGDISFDTYPVPDPHTTGRMPQIIEATRIMSRATEGKVPVFAHAIGPMTLASRIMDIEKMLYMIVDYPDRFRVLLEYCASVTRSFAAALVTAGADGILIFDPAGSPSVLPASIFAEFEEPILQLIIAELKERDRNTMIWYSVAGPVQTGFSGPLQVACDIVTVDYVTPIDIAIAKTNASVINGNIKPALFLEGDTGQIKAEARSLLAETKVVERFILGSGCEVPLNSPIENIRALVEVAMEPQTTKIRKRASTNPVKVTLWPHGVDAYVQKGDTLLDAIHLADAPITSYCDRSGSCGKCVVQLKEGALTPPDKIEELQLNVLSGDPAYRLACLAKVVEPVSIYIPYFSRIFHYKALSPDESIEMSLEEGIEPYGYDPNISVVKLDATLERSLHKEGFLNGFSVSKTVMEEYTQKKEGNNNGLNGVIDKERKEVVAFSRSGDVLGMAVDIGTTTISAYVHDLVSRKLICFGSIENPQTQWGLNMISRVARLAEDPKALSSLQQKLIEGINSLVKSFFRDFGISGDQIFDMIVVGNPVMTHLFLGLNPESLSRYPFTPLETEWVSATAGSLRSSQKVNVHKRSRVEVLPLMGGFVGSDIVAGAMATGMQFDDESSLYIDIGTNGELVIGNQDRLLCASVAAGPAFEGLHFTSGSRYQKGVIESVTIDENGKTAFTTAGGGSPVGLCGSSVIDIIAAFLRHEIIDTRGGFINREKWPQTKGDVFVLVEKQDTATFTPIVISRKDIEEVQKAKSAFMTGISLLITELGVHPRKIKKIYITGSFGFSINLSNARRIGMIPDFPWARTHFLKNSAGLGGRIVLLSTKARAEARKFADSVTSVNLVGHPDFSSLFIDNMFFPAPS